MCQEDRSFHRFGACGGSCRKSLEDVRGRSSRGCTALKRMAFAIAAVLCISTSACIDLSGLVAGLTGDTLETALTGPYIVGGVMEVDAETRPCSLFREDSGVTYLLFQGTRMTNEDFDTLFQDGAWVRLEINRRNGLLTNCGGGTIVEVQEVLELIPPGAD